MKISENKGKLKKKQTEFCPQTVLVASYYIISDAIWYDKSFHPIVIYKNILFA